MPTSKKAVIVGGGLVGSLLAVILARRGYEIDVYERRADMRKAGYVGGRSINLALSERGWKAVEIAGIRSQIEQVAIPMPGRMIHREDGQEVFQAYGKEGQAISSVSRGGLNLELINIADKFPNVSFHFNQICKGLDTDEQLIHFEDADTGAAYAVESDLIFGTDGAFSAVRSHLQRLPRYNYSQHYIEHGYKELTIAPDEQGRHRLSPHALHIWPRRHFMLIALPNTDGSFTCTLFLPFEGGEESFEYLRGEVRVMEFFNRFFPDAVPLMPTLLEDFANNPASALVTVRCEPWHHGSQVLLLGDASHAIVPFFGQGMNAGFEDCTILDALIDKHEDHWPAIIGEFNASRIKDANAIADLALANFIEMRDKVADPEFLLWKKIEHHLHERFPSEFQSVYSMVSFSHIPYSQALAEVAEHERLLRKVLAIPGIRSEWNGPEVEAAFREWQQERQKAAVPV